jgi:hypothetical protein
MSEVIFRRIYGYDSKLHPVRFDEHTHWLYECRSCGALILDRELHIEAFHLGSSRGEGQDYQGVEE